MKHSLRLTTWIALADFFSAIALVGLALYGHQRQQNIRVSTGIKHLTQQVYERLRANGVDASPSLSEAAISLPETVLFRPGQFDIEHPDKLAKIAATLKEVRSGWERRFVLVIRGHTDAWPPRAVPGAPYSNNLELSWLRANTVEKELATNGVSAPGFQIATQGVGQEEPVVDNCTGQSAVPRAYCEDVNHIRRPADLVRNRRIELRFGFFSGNALDASRLKR
jgi:outer membrane protein OmpA-like peptidoglycan-associated protein